ncbi:P-loop containing nucleoside triphosphate hydrolase protein [Mycena olivaceomarginata]|nr:P-loop containing nucleoside triphosphate hydrolase protein [Mycena olivaceomarginata]
MSELLNQLDGFDTHGDVKVIVAANKIESLDPALICPGRIDREIEFRLPDVKTKRHIFRSVPSCWPLALIACGRLHTSRTSLSNDVDLKELVMTKDDLSDADIKAVCTKAGVLALRERHMRDNKADFTSAREKVLFTKNEGTPEGLYL